VHVTPARRRLWPEVVSDFAVEAALLSKKPASPSKCLEREDDIKF